MRKDARSLRADDYSALLEKLLSKERKPLLAYVESQMGPALRAKIEPEDILQNASQRAFQKISEFEPEEDALGSLAAWFREFVRREVPQAGRRHLGTRRTVRTGIEYLESDLLKQTATDDDTPSRKAGAIEAHAFLADAVKQLTEDAQQAIRLFYFEHQPIEAIATSIGKSKSATAKLLERSRNRLRELMGQSSHYYFQQGKRKSKSNEQ